jgi:hypothetical protein
MPQPSLRISSRVRNPPTRYDDYVSSMALVLLVENLVVFMKKLRYLKVLNGRKL